MIQPASSSVSSQPADTIVDPTAAPQEKPVDAQSTRFAALARKEQQIRQAQLKLAAEREALKAKDDEYRTKYIPREKLTDKESLWSTLQELGHTAEDLLALGLNPPQGKDPHLSALEAKLKAMEERTELSAKQAAEAQTKQYEQAINQIRNDTKLLVESNSDYETIKTMGATEAVVKLIEKTYNTEGKLLSVEEASQQVEAKLFDRAMKMAAIGKVKAKLLPPEPVKPDPKQGFASIIKQQAQQQTQQPQQIKTLTNAQNASSAALTAKEKRERAILAFKGQL